MKHLNSREIWLELVFKDIDEGLRKTAISSFVVKFGFDKKFIKMIPFNTEANRRVFWEGYIHIQKTMEKGLQQEIKRYIEGLDESSKMRAKEILDQFEEFYKLE